MLDRVVFQDVEIGNFINENFMSIRLNVKTGDGQKFKEDFNVFGFPTVVFVGPDGKEIDRTIGFNGDKDNYFAIIQDYAAGRNTLGALVIAYQEDTLSVEANYLLANKYYDRRQNRLAYQHYHNVLKLDAADQAGLNQECAFKIAVIQARYLPEPDPGPLFDFLQDPRNKDYLAGGYENLARYYKNAKDTTRYFASLEKVIDIAPGDASLLNEYAWAVFKAQLSSKYQQALQFAVEADKIAPDSPGILDTIAWLHYVMGDHDKAETVMAEAVQIDSGYKRRLAILKKAIEKEEFNIDDV